MWHKLVVVGVICWEGLSKAVQFDNPIWGYLGEAIRKINANFLLNYHLRLNELKYQVKQFESFIFTNTSKLVLHSKETLWRASPSPPISWFAVSNHTSLNILYHYELTDLRGQFGKHWLWLFQIDWACDVNFESKGQCSKFYHLH